MQLRAISTGKISIAVVENQGQISSRENNGIDSIAPQYCLRQSRQVRMLLSGAFPRASHLDVRTVDRLDFVRPPSHDLDVAEFTEKRRFHDEAGTQERDASSPARRKFLAERFEDVQNRQRGSGSKLPHAEVRCDRRDGGHLGSSRLHPAKVAIQIFGQSIAIVRLDILEHPRRIRMGDDDVQQLALRLNFR
jgi:hypothetical protein